MITTTVTDILVHHRFPLDMDRHPSTSTVSVPHLNFIRHISNSDHIHGVVSRALHA